MLHSTGHTKMAIAFSACAATLMLVPSLSLAQTVRVIGSPDGDLAAEVLGQVHAVPFCHGNNTPILLQAEKVNNLPHEHVQEIEATVRAGYPVLMLSPNMSHIRALNRIAGARVNFRAPVNYPIQAYSLRMVKGVPTGFLLHTAAAPEIASTS
jgi:hypothetical protein